MINIRFYRDESDKIQKLLMTGHAGFGEYGEDIVCAAASAQVISVENSLVQLLNINPTTHVDEIEGGYLELTLPADLTSDTEDDAQLLMRHLYLAYQVLEKNYPNFIQVQDLDYIL